MPQTRAYSREELQSLRRADLQRLCKIHDIKGANAKSGVLIDLLTQYFQSSAHDTEPSRSTQTRPAQTRVPRRAVIPSRALPASHQTKNAPTAHSTTSCGSGYLAPRRAPARRPAAPQSETTVNGSGAVSGSRFPNPNGRAVNAASLPSELQKLRVEVEQLRATVARLEEEQSSALLRLIDGDDFQLKLRALVTAEITSSANRSNDGSTSPARTDNRSLVTDRCSHSHAVTDGVHGLQGVGSSSQSKRKQPETVGHDVVDVKRARHDVSGSPRSASSVLRRTLPRDQPSPSTMCTPQRALQKTPPAHVSALPVTHTLPLQRVSDLGRSQNGGATASSTLRSECPVRKPTVPTSQETPTTPRVELLAEVGGPAPADASFKCTDGERTARCMQSTATSPGRSHLGHRALNTFTDASFMSPARIYMDVALNGLAGRRKSPDTSAANCRTLLGTERYRDTRFGDEPMVAWGTPTMVDFGSPTPSDAA